MIYHNLAPITCEYAATKTPPLNDGAGADAVRFTTVRIDDQWPSDLLVRFATAAQLELVLRGDPDTEHARALSYLADEALLAPGITLKQSVLQGEGDRLPNPSLAISDGSMTIKFHPYSIREIVTSENPNMAVATATLL